MRRLLSPGAALLAASLLLAGVGCARRAELVQAPAETSAPGVTVNAPANAPAPPPAPATGGSLASTNSPGAGTPTPRPPISIPEPVKPAGPPAAVPAEGVKLVYKFARGSDRQYQVAITQEMTMSLPQQPGQSGAGMMPGGMRMAVDGSLLFTHAVKSVAANGQAQVTSQAREGDLNVSMGPQELTIKVQDGKATAMVNGQAQPDSKQADQMVRGIANANAELKISPTGQVLSTKNVGDTGGPASQMPAGGLSGRQVSGGYGMLVLPKKAVKPGDSWTDVQTETRPAPRQKGKPVKITRRTTYTLKEVIQQEGRQIAVIESTTIVASPAEALAALLPGSKVQRHSESITGTTQFDVDAGEIVLAHYKAKSSADLSVNIPAGMMGGGGNTPSAAPPSGMKIAIIGSGTIQVTKK